MRPDRPADDHPGEDVLDEGHVAEPGPGPNIGEVRDPQTVRSLRGEVALDEIRWPSGLLVAASGELGPSSPSPLQASFTHETPHPITTDRDAFAVQLVPELASTVDPVVLLEHARDLFVKPRVGDRPEPAPVLWTLR